MPTTIGAHRDPVKLVNPDGETHAWNCGACGSVWMVNDQGFDPEDAARRCCAVMICECGEKTEMHRTACKACISKHEAEKEQALFDKAEKIPWHEYDGEMVYSERQEYYPDVETMLDSEDDPPDDPPSWAWACTPWAWACTPLKMSFDAAELIQDKLETEEHHEEAYVGDDGIKELQAFLDKWCEKHSVESYFPDYTRVVTCEDLVEERRAELDEDEVSEGK